MVLELNGFDPKTVEANSLHHAKRIFNQRLNLYTNSRTGNSVYPTLWFNLSITICTYEIKYACAAQRIPEKDVDLYRAFRTKETVERAKKNYSIVNNYEVHNLMPKYKDKPIDVWQREEFWFKDFTKEI